MTPKPLGGCGLRAQCARFPAVNAHRVKHRLHSQALLGKRAPQAHLADVRTAPLASRPNLRSTGQTLKENPDEEDHARGRPDRRLCRARHGRRFPERLPDPALTDTLTGDTTMKKIMLAVALIVASAAPVMAEGFPNVYMTR